MPTARAADRARSSSPAAHALPFDPTLDRIFAPRDRLRLFAHVVARDRAPLSAAISAQWPRTT
jgi:hypothetical protein